MECLGSLGEYQEILAPIFQEGGVELVLALLDSPNVELLGGTHLFYFLPHFYSYML